MATDDKEPRSVMSRGKGDGHVVHGARMVKHRRWTSPHRGTWPAATPSNSHGPGQDVQPASKRHKRPRTVKEKAAKPPIGEILTAAAALTSSQSMHTSQHAAPTLGRKLSHAGYDGDDILGYDGGSEK